MACPHVSGQVAKYLETNPSATSTIVKAWLQSNAQQGVILNIRTKRCIFIICALKEKAKMNEDEKARAAAPSLR